MENAIELEKSWPQPTGASQGQILFRYIFKILPQVKKKLRYWECQANKIEDKILQAQALTSLKNKAFHCHGGAVYALNYADGNDLIDLIVAYQTICDYLDNLCDRAGVTEEKAFFTLHQALIDALSPRANYKDYYHDYAYTDDSGYLGELVSCCQKIVRELPSYDVVYPDLINLANLYIHLQVKKHLDWSQREQVLIEWAQEQSNHYPLIKWQEFAAASGSTLAVFALFSLASQKNLSPIAARSAVEAYFPWICGLHILLDYVIDQEEDRKEGDLNFTFYYNDDQEMLERLKLFTIQAKSRAGSLTPENFHLTVVQGLLAMYLSDAKVEITEKSRLRAELLREMGSNTLNIYRLCKTVRKLRRL